MALKGRVLRSLGSYRESKEKIVLSFELWITPDSVLDKHVAHRKAVCTIWAKHTTEQNTEEGIVP